MLTQEEKSLGFNVVANGRNWNAIKLVTGTIARGSGHHLTSIQFRFRENEVFVIVKKDTPKGAEISFTAGKTLDDALYVLAKAITGKTLRWKSDKWVSMRNDKKARG